MSIQGRKTGSTGIQLSGSSAHLENVHVEGFDVPISMDSTSRATFKNVTTRSWTRPTPRKNQQQGARGSKVGWTRAAQIAFDPRASARLATHLGGENPFDDPKQLIDRARDHIRDLEALVAEFWGRKPFAPTIERDESAGQQVHKVRLTENFPNRPATVAKDAFSNLRDALDHAVYASAVTMKPGSAPTKTAFPFADDAPGVSRRLLSKDLRDIPAAMRPLLESFEPHKSGNQLLWGLNRTRNVETHRIVVPLLVASTGNSLRINGGVLGEGQIGCSRWDPEKKEAEFLRVGIGSQVEYRLDVGFSVLLGDVDVIGGAPALDSLYEITKEVESIVLAIEAETAKHLP
jgi:hypothetical protein